MSLLPSPARCDFARSPRSHHRTQRLFRPSALLCANPLAGLGCSSLGSGEAGGWINPAEQINESFRAKLARHALRPFRHFTLLWCLLLLLTTHRWLLRTALVVVSVQLVALLIGIALSFTSNDWLSKFSQAFQQESEKLIKKVTEANAEVTQDVRSAWVSLRLYLMGVYFLQDPPCRSMGGILGWGYVHYHLLVLGLAV